MNRGPWLAWLLASAACAPGPSDPASPAVEVSRNELHRATLVRDLARDPANTTRVQLANGATAVRIESGFRHVTMVRPADGGVRQDCVQTETAR